MTKPKKIRQWPKPTTIASWAAQALLIIAAVTPVLPDATPAWLRTTLVIIAAVLGVFTHRAGSTEAP